MFGEQQLPALWTSWRNPVMTLLLVLFDRLLVPTTRWLGSKAEVTTVSALPYVRCAGLAAELWYGGFEGVNFDVAGTAATPCWSCSKDVGTSASAAALLDVPLFLQRSIALPDVHSGYGFAIGNVAAFDMSNPEVRSSRRPIPTHPGATWWQPVQQQHQQHQQAAICQRLWQRMLCS
jgi:hypothetical protein